MANILEVTNKNYSSKKDRRKNEEDQIRANASRLSELESTKRVMAAQQANSNLQQKKKAQQEYLESEQNVGFWDAIRPGGATPSEWNESRKKKAQYEKEVEEAAAQVAAYEQFWQQQKVQGKTSAEIDSYLTESDKKIAKLDDEKVGFFEAMKPGGVKPSERKAINAEKEAEIKKIESQQGMYRAVRDEKKSREMTDGLPEDVKQLLDEYNSIGDTTQANQMAAVFAPESSMMYNSANNAQAERKKKIAQELVKMGYSNYAELAEYRQYVKDVESARAAEESIAEFAKEHPVASSAMSVALSPAASIAGAVGTAENVLKDKKSDLGANPYDSWYYLDEYRNVTRQAVPETFEDGMLSAKTKGMLYNTAMSGTDSALAGLTMGSAGGIMLGVGALNDTYTDVLKRGGTEEQALMSGVLAGTAEGVFEAVSLGYFFKGVEPTDVMGIAKNVLVQAGVNAQEEAATEAANILTDYLINGGLSDYYQSYEYALSTGMSEEEAKAYAKKISAEQIGEAALSGALMGAGFGVIGSAAGNISYNSALKDAGRQNVNEGKVDNVLAGASDIEGNEKVSSLIGKVEAGQSSDKLKGKDYKNIGKLIEQLNKVTGEDRSKLIETAVKERLVKVGETENTDIVAKAIVKKINGEKLTHKENKAFEKSKKSTQVYREAIGYIYDAEWSRKLDSDIHALYERRYEPDIEAYRAKRGGKTLPESAEPAAPSKIEPDEAAENVKEQFKTALIQEGQDAEIFDAGFELYYEQGRSGGYEFTEIKNNPNVSEGFTEYQRQQAFEQGQYQALKDIGNARYKGDTVGVFINGYSKKDTVKRYASAFNIFYSEGMHSNMSFEEVFKREGLDKVIDEATAKKAFEAGRKQSTSAQRSDEKQIKRAPKKDGSYVSKTIEEGEIDTFLEAFSKKLGLDTVRVQKIINGEDEANAQIDLKSGKMVSSASSRNEYQSTIHESVHLAYAYGDTKKMAEIETSMKDFFIHLHGAASFENVIRQYAEAYTDLDRAGVMEEFTADALAGVFSSEDGINEFVDWLQKDSGYSQAEKKTILEKLSEWLLEIVDKIKELIEEGHLNNVTEAYAKAQAEQFTEVREKFLEALDGATVNYREGGAVEGDVRNSIKHPSFSEKDIKDNMIELAKMQPVFVVEEDKLKKTGLPPSKIFEEFFNSLNNNIYSETFGDIALKKSSIKSETRHGITSEKIASIEAIPTVIEKGKVIFFETKKDSDVKRIVVAAPIKIGNEPYYMGVMLQRDSLYQRLYLHNVVIEKEMPMDSQADLLTTGALEDNEHLYITTILQNALVVKNKYMEKKGKYSLKEQDSKARILTREQSEFFKDSKIRVSEVDGRKNTITPDGELFPVYHGTNSDEFFEFDKKAIGSANDTGWYGKGFYFAFDEREARFYGRRTMECYLNVKKPFFFSEEMQSFKGQSSGDVNFDFASFIINLSEKFPEIAKKTFVEVAEFNSDEVTDRSFAEFAEEIKEIYDSNRFKLSEVDDGGTTTYQYVYSRDIDNIEASETIKRLIREKFIDSSWSAEYYKDKGVITESEFDEILDLFEKYGESRFRDVWIPGRFTDAEYAKKNRLSSVITYLANKKYSYINQHMPEYYMENYIGDDLSQELRKRGYDGILQSKFGDEIVVFDSNQIKLVDNKKPTESPDIRYSRKFSLDWIDFAEEQERERSAVSELTELERINEELRAQIRHPGVKHIVSQLGVQKVARHLKSEYMSKINIHKLAGELGDFYTLIANGDGISWDSLQIHIERIADMILDESKYKKPDISDYAKDVLRDIRSVKIKLNDDQKREIANRFGSYGNFHKAMFGRVMISNDGVSLDERWQELSAMYPNLFDVDLADLNQPEALFDIVVSLRETYEDMNGMDLASAKDMLMTEIYEQYFEVPETKYISEEYKLKYAKAKAEFGEKIREAKAEYKRQTDEAYKKAKAEYGEILKGIREEEAEAILRIKARYNLRAEKMGDTRVKEKKRNNIKRNVKRLDRLLRNPGKSAPSAGVNKYGQEYVHLTNIPEEFRKAVIEFCSIFINNDAGVFTGYSKRDSITVREKKVEHLQKIYALMQNSDSYLSDTVAEEMQERIDIVAQIMAEKRLSDLSIEELDRVIEITEYLTASINAQVAVWVEGKKSTVKAEGDKIIADCNRKGNKAYLGGAAYRAIKGWGVNNFKPVYFFEQIGGPLEKLYLAMQNEGQRVYARNISSAAAFMEAINKKYDYQKWQDEDALVLETKQGHKLKLTKAQAMHIWATAQRERLAGKDAMHLMQGGIVFDDEIEADIIEERDKSTGKKESKLTSKVFKYKTQDGSAHRIHFDDVMKIDSYLTQEQKAFVNECVRYLSVDMAALGNEISLELYGIKRFNEKFYIPYNSAKNFIYRKMGENGNAMLRNKSFTKETVFAANNPLVVGDFLEVIATHIEEMSMYNAMVLPLDNFNRVWNYKTIAPEDDPTKSGQSVKSVMETAYGREYVQYIDRLLEDINGGISSDAREKAVDKLISKFKKTAVLGSASVVIQQPSAIVRAFAEIDPSYFMATTFAKRKAAWERALQYSSTALLKDIGGFDTVSGRNTVDWLTNTEYKGKDKVLKFFADSQYRDDVLAWGPSFADKVTWAHIWAACERETASKNKSLQGEELYKKTGERFDEVINRTQVYDSVFSRSDHMRSKSSGMKMLTAFMSEPTVQANMYASAVNDFKGGNKSKGARKVGAVILSQLFNATLVSIIYGARDDDEDETLVEKYLSEVVNNFLGSLNPLGMVPLYKDIVSLLQGFDVNRTDMAVISKFVDAVQKVFSKNTKLTKWDRAKGIIGAVGDLWGIPLTNLIREGEAIFNVAGSVKGIGDTTLKGIGYAISDDFAPELQKLSWYEPSTKDERLYAAFSEGDKKMYNRIATQYTSGGSIKSALKKQIGKRFVEGDIDEQTAISQFRKLGLTENEAYYEVRSLKDPLPEEESEDTNADFFDFDSMQSVQGNADAESDEAKGDYDWLENALATGDRSDIQKEINDLKSRGVSEDDINSKIKSWIKVNDSTVAAEAERYKQGNLNSFESTVKSIASKYGADESSAAGAIRSAAGVNSKAIDGTIYAYGDLHTAMNSNNSAQSKKIAGEIVNAKTQQYIAEGETNRKAKEKAENAVRTSLRSYWKEEYLKSDTTRKGYIRLQLKETGLWTSSEVLKMTREWESGE